MDGNYNRTLEIRLKRDDVVIYFDFPVLICIWNAFIRVI